MEEDRDDSWTQPGVGGEHAVVTDEPFHARPLIALDADGSINAEPTGAPPSEHAVGVGLVEETVGAQIA